MIRTTLQQVSDWVGGSLVSDADQVLTIRGVGTDTRQDLGGRLFIALEGPNFDAHAFLQQAADQGAVAALVSHHRRESSLPQVVVDDTHQALAMLARAWRDAVDPLVIAITGSSGKTTVKEMLAAMLRQAGPTAATRGNFNNDIGVPLTLLDWSQATRFAVVEMGANHVGEIAALTELVGPDIALVTMAGQAHVGEFGSLERIIEGKGELYRHCPASCRALINLDSAGADIWRKAAPQAQTFSLDEAHERWPTWLGEYQAAAHRLSVREHGAPLFASLSIPMPGAHNAVNLLASVALARMAGLDAETILAGLSGFTPPAGRMARITLANGWRLLDDSYNANPESMRAAIAYLAGLSGRRLAVLGSMGELGDLAEALHRQVGEMAATAELDGVVAVGPGAEAMQAGFRAAGGAAAGLVCVADSEEASEALRAWLAGDELTVLLKGSRFMHIERVRDGLEREHGVLPGTENDFTRRG